MYEVNGIIFTYDEMFAIATSLAGEPMLGLSTCLFIMFREGWDIKEVEPNAT